MLSKDQIKQFKSQATALKPITSVGKNGISENLIMQVQNNVKVHKLCKVKILRSFLDESGLDKKVVAQDIAYRSGCELVQLVGLMVILYKR